MVQRKKNWLSLERRESSGFAALPLLPDLARSLLKDEIMLMVNAGLITGADAEQLIALLQLKDA